MTTTAPTLPRVIQKRLELPWFTAMPFTPTKFADAEAKARFAQHFARFLARDMAEPLFTQAFYRRLSNTFGHIAHYSRYSFLDHYFRTYGDRRRFLEDTMDWRPVGDPAWTFVDVEIGLQQRIRNSGLLALYGITCRPLRPIVTGTTRQPEPVTPLATPPTGRSDPFIAT
ncbi:MAG: hypothetical protein AB7I59_01695 [Geminicoccaceae bacterium]